MDMKQGTAVDINRLWYYLLPLGDERDRMFVHLMQVNNKRNHFEKGYDQVKSDIINGNYTLRPLKNKYKESFNEVLEELLEKKEYQRQNLVLMFQKPLDLFDRSNLKPSKFYYDLDLHSLDKMIKGWKPEEKKEVYSWGVKSMNNFFDDDYTNDEIGDRFLKEESYEYKYEEEMDVFSSLEFALSYILARSKNGIRGFANDTKLPVPFCETVKALSSCIKKLDKDLTEAYLRGFNDARKPGRYSIA